MAKSKGMTPLVCLHTIYSLTEQVPLTVKDRAQVEAMRNVVHEFIEQAQKPTKKPKKKPRK